LIGLPVDCDGLAVELQRSIRSRVGKGYISLLLFAYSGVNVINKKKSRDEQGMEELPLNENAVM
jgi:hypothetical protein